MNWNRPIFPLRCTFALASALIVTNLPAAVLYVKEDADEGGEGTSWADAMYSLQDALFYSQPGDEIWVTAGTYYPDYGDAVFEGDRFASFELKDGVSVYGGFAGTETQRSQRDPALNQTLLSGGIGSLEDGSEDSIHVVTASDNDATAILDGVTITQGSADSGTGEYSHGGGLYIVNGSPSFVNITFRDNQATTGGALHVEGASSSPTFTNCTFTTNTAFYDGGAANSANASPEFINCTFSGNFALDGVAGAIYVQGTGVLIATDCTFSSNEAKYGGGAMATASSSPKLTRCTFSANTTSDGSGGGLDNDQGAPELANCTFSGNTSNYAGGGIANWSGNLLASSTTFITNQDSGDYGGGGVFNYQASPTFTECAFESNYADYGGGFYNLDGAPVFQSCTFTSNSEGENEGSGGGGAMFNYDGAPKLSDCTFSYNQSAYGAGIYNYFDAVIAANPTIVRCTFSDNSSSHATEGGGAAIMNWNAQPTIYNCYFLRNTAPVGGAIWNDADGIGGTLANSLFANNTASDSGGAVYNPPDTNNCTFHANTAATGSAIYDTAGKTLSNCILYGNTATTQGNPIESATLIVNYSLVEGGYTGESNLDADPGFADISTGDYSLASSSPCIDGGDSTLLPSDAADLDGDSDTEEMLPIDLTGKERVEGESVDMGAYEFNGNREPVISHAGGVEEAAISTDEGQVAVATVTASDPDQNVLTYSISGGADESFFTIDASSGALTFKTAPDFETLADADKDGTYLVIVQVTDDGAGSLSDTQSLFVTINNINEAPVLTSHSGNAEVALSLKEGSTAVSEVMAIDPDDDNLSFVLSAGADQALFSVDSTGALFFKNAPDYGNPTDANVDNIYEVTVQVADADFSVLQAFAITITSDSDSDTDSDGIPDNWENQYGLNPDADDSATDSDGDLLTNLQEYQLGTDPTDGNSGFHAHAVTSSGGGKFTLRWKSVSGKSYTVQSSTDFSTWADLSGPHIATATESSAEVIIDTAVLRSFFRIVLAE